MTEGQVNFLTSPIPHFKSMGEGQWEKAHFSQILVVITNSTMDDISHDHTDHYHDHT